MMRALCGAGLLAAAVSFILVPAARAKTLVYCSEASPETFNPMVGVSDPTMDASARAMYNRLVEMRPGTTNLRPALAESWDISPDGLSYTFHLRSGVAFHSNKRFTPTRPFDADDVVYSFTRQWQKDNPYHALSGKTYEFFEGMGLGDLLAGIDKVDDHTVQFRLKEPNATFMLLMGMDFASILSLEYTKAMVAAGTPDAIDQDPIGTGPFIFVSYSKDSQIRYRANPDYWGGKPKIDLVIAITPEPEVRVAKIRNGECHVTTLPPALSLPALAADPNITLLHGPGQNVGYLGYNVEHKPFDDKRVRNALALAINRPAIIDAIYHGTGTLAKTFIPPGELGSLQDIPQRPYDPAAAKKLLAEAGFPNGFTTTLWAGAHVSRPYNPNAARMAELVQADWAAIGVTAKIVTYEWGTFLDKTKLGEQEAFFLGGTSDNGDPDNLTSYFLSCQGAHNGSNRSRWCNQEFEATITEARRISDPAKRAALYEKAQRIALDEAPIVPIAHSVQYTPIRKVVTGYVLDLFNRQNFANLDLTE